LFANLERRNAELQRIKDARMRWWKKLSRAVTAIDRLNLEERRWLKPRRLEKHETTIKIDSKDWHRIREQDFGDEVPDLS
jgi:hypothetical protein